MPRQPTAIPSIVQAAMAGGPSTVVLAAAVSNAGGLGFLAGGYVSAGDLSASITQLRAATTAAFGVNIFAIRERPVDEAALAAYVATLEPDARALDVALGASRFDDDGFDDKLAVLLDGPVPVVSFAFGCPDAAVIAELQRVGTSVWITVTNDEEATIAGEAGADVLIAQGADAGGHRSSFDDADAMAAPSALALVAEIEAATHLPIVAAGGIATAADVRAVLAAGAAAAQCGTAFLLADEAGTHPLHRAAVASDRASSFTRAYTGRTARGIVTEFMRAHPDAPSAYPQLHHVTSPLRTAARLAGDAERMSLWAGTRHHLAQARPAAEIVAALRGESSAE